MWLVFSDGRFERRPWELCAPEPERIIVGDLAHRRVRFDQWERLEPWRPGGEPVDSMVGEFETCTIERVFARREWRVPRVEKPKRPACSWCERSLKREVAERKNTCGRCGGPIPWWLIFEPRRLYVETA